MVERTACGVAICSAASRRRSERIGFWWSWTNLAGVSSASVSIVASSTARAVPHVPTSNSGHALPKYLSSNHDRLYQFQQWQANLRVLGVTEIKTVPSVPLSHPFVERLIGTIRRELLDGTLFWTTSDLETKLTDFQHYYNAHRTHAGLAGRLPEQNAAGSVPIHRCSYRWQSHCRGLYQTPAP